MKLIPENIGRKVDSLGRIIIPKSLRQRLGFIEGEILDYYTLEYDGATFLCLGHSEDVTTKYKQAANVLTELGLEIPRELEELISAN